MPDGRCSRNPGVSHVRQGDRPDEQAQSEAMNDKIRIAKISIVSSTVKPVAIHHVLQLTNHVT